MENKTFKFKTNINCEGCITAVKPHLDNAQGVSDWEVDTANKDKILTVSSNGASQDQVIQVVQQAGYKIEVI